MELKQIKELMAAMGRTGTKKIAIKKDTFELVIEREEHSNGRFLDPQIEFSEDSFRQSLIRTDLALSHGSEMPPREMISSSAAESSKEGEKNGKHIISPMVGTFYNAPSPEDAPFIKVGDKVDKNTVVCIVEAMKVMNEIKANISGTVAEILVDTAHPVEFGSKLFRIVE